MEHGETLFKFGVPKDRLPVILGPDESMQNALFYDEPFQIYLGDARHFNAGGAVEILDSPRAYIHKLLNNDLEVEPDHFRFGRAVHMAVLEPARFRELYLIEPEFTGLTKEGKESSQSGEARKKKKDWYEGLDSDSMVLTPPEMDLLCEMIDCLLEHPQARNMFRDGRPEVTGRWLHPGTRICCKIRPDYLTIMPDGSYYFFDLKSTRTASAGLFATEAARLHYQVKMAFYWDGLTAILGREPNACALVPVEKSIPSKAEVFWLPEKDIDDGRRRYTYAIESLLRCLQTGKWPRPRSGGQMLSLPAWVESEPLPEFDWGNNGAKGSLAEDPFGVQPEARSHGDDHQ